MNPQYYDDVSHMIDNELNREYEVNCIRCDKRLTVWYKCPHCQLIYFCDCHQSPTCTCTDSYTDMRSIIEGMKQLVYRRIDI